VYSFWGSYQVTVEEHTIVEGLGSSVADILIRKNPIIMKMVGIKDIFAVVGKHNRFLDYFGLAGLKIASSTENFIA